MIMTSNSLLIDKTTLGLLKSNYFAYLDAALADANGYVVGNSQHNVVTYFGALAAFQKSILVDGLKMLKKAAKDYTVGGKTYQRKIEWCLSSGSELHSTNQYAASHAYGVWDLNKHFALRIYSGLLLASQSYDWKVNTMYHELSHRVLETEDVSHSSTGNAPAYGQTNVQNLAAADPASALQNASNWAYYINFCNGQTNWPI
jgi:hypothetical protein